MLLLLLLLLLLHRTNVALLVWCRSSIDQSKPSMNRESIRCSLVLARSLGAARVMAADRPKYRSSWRKDPATVVYTIAKESAYVFGLACLLTPTNQSTNQPINACDSYLIVTGVPSLGTEQELLALFSQYGQLEYVVLSLGDACAIIELSVILPHRHRVLHDAECEKFTDVHWFRYHNIDDARCVRVCRAEPRTRSRVDTSRWSRRAKRKLDEYFFFGRHIQVRYAPEEERPEDTAAKLHNRREHIRRRVAPSLPPLPPPPSAATADIVSTPTPTPTPTPILYDAPAAPEPPPPAAQPIISHIPRNVLVAPATTTTGAEASELEPATVDGAILAIRSKLKRVCRRDDRPQRFSYSLLRL